MTLFLRALGEPDDARREKLINDAVDIFTDAASERWRRRLRAASALLDQAEAALDRGEASDDPGERRRQLALFELYLTAARVET